MSEILTQPTKHAGVDYVPPEILQAIHRLVYQGCLYLNDEAWKDFIGLCDASFQYRVVAFSPEIRREQCWADRSYKVMKAHFDLMPRHNTDHSKLTRQVQVYTVDYDEATREARVVSALTIYRTQLDGINSYLESGQTSLYAVGVYKDRVKLVDNVPKLIERVVELDTRQLDVGTHKPF
jgi:methanesulfonate monooxygenase small subunit